MKKAMEELVAIAREWSSYTRQFGRGHKSYCDDFVHCYHAEDSDHRTVKFGQYPHQLEVTFHLPVRIEGTIQMLQQIDHIVDRATGLLANFKDGEERRSKEEREAEKKARIAALQEQLEELSA